MTSSKNLDSNTNCEDDELPALVTLNALRSIPKLPPVVFALSAKEVVEALSSTLRGGEEDAIQYLAGYAFKRLLSMHRSKQVEGKVMCLICSQFGSKFGNSAVPSGNNDLFLYLKRFEGSKATLYKADPQFCTMVKCVLKVVRYVFVKHLSIPNVLATIVESILEHVSPVVLPNLCSTSHLRKVLHLLSKTLFLFQVKCKKAERKSEVAQTNTLKRPAPNKNERVVAKFKKLTHQ